LSNIDIDDLETKLINNYTLIEMKKIPDFGSVVFTSQDGNIVQIETTIKER